MSQRTEFSRDFSKNKQRIDELLQIDKSFDLLYRVVIIGVICSLLGRQVK